MPRPLLILGLLTAGALGAATWLLSDRVDAAQPDAAGTTAPARDVDSPQRRSAPAAPPPTATAPRPQAEDPHAAFEAVESAVRLEPDALPIEALTTEQKIQEGSFARSVYHNPRLVMEFASVADPRNLERPYPGARLVRLPKAGPIWLLPKGLTYATVQQQLASTGRRVSAVFHGGDRSDTGMRALPGGLSLEFDSAWSAARIEAFAKRHRLRGLRPMGVGENWRFLPTEPSLAGLKQAKRLRSLDGVRSATPNWWRERTRR